MRARSKSAKSLATAASLCVVLALAIWTIASPSQTPAPYDTPPALPQQDPTQSPHLEILQWKANIQPSCDLPAVVVGVIVEKHGRPMNVHVVHGCGMGLDEKAVESVMHTQFKPALKDGVPTAVNINVKVIFDPADK
jgi:TonB family protein